MKLGFTDTMFNHASIGFALDVLDAKHELENKAEKEPKPKVRKATQADFNAF